MNLDLGRFDYEATDFLPLVAHHSPEVALMLDGSFMAILRVAGFEHHMLSPEERNIRRRQLNTLLMQIADDNVQIGVHLVRHRGITPFAEGAYQSAFAFDLNAKYRAHIAGDLWVNDWFVTLMVSPRFRPSLSLNRLRRRNAPAPQSVDDLIQALEDRVHVVRAFLRDAGVVRLGVRSDGRGGHCSEMAEAQGLILTGSWYPVPLVDGPLGVALYNRRARCGQRGVQIDDFTGPRFCMMMGLKRYMTPTRTGMLDGLLSAPFGLVMTSWARCTSVAAASTKVALHKIRMSNAGDVGETEEGGLESAQRRLLGGKEVRVSHHFSLAVYGDTHAEMLANSGEAANIIGKMGAVPAMEDRGSFAAYWAQLAGQVEWLRTRPGDISSKNLTAFMGLDGVPRGHRSGKWGTALARFVTSHGTAYDFCPHVADVGHAMFLGRSGRGKTALMTFLSAALEKAIGKHGTLVYFDKDRGAEPSIRARGGVYVRFRRGADSGCAPLVWASDTPEDAAWLHFWLTALIESDERGPLPTGAGGRLARGIARQLKLLPERRSFGGIREFLGFDEGGAGARFERWCRGGSLGWAFDNPEDRITTKGTLLGFDLTALFDDPTVCGATATYLTHRLEGLIDGRRIAVVWDEMAFSLQVPAFAKITEDFALTLRKKNGILWMAAQEPEHFLRVPCGESLVSQCTNTFVFPAKRANRAAYAKIGLTEQHVAMVTETMPALPYRSVLLLREDGPVVLRFDLSGMDDEIAVLSGRLEAMPALDRAIEENGVDPSNWLGRWLAEARNAKAMEEAD